MFSKPGVYFGVEGGLNWMFNTTILNQNVSPYTGWALGGKIGYDFLGPRVEVEGLYRQNNNSNNFGNRAITNQISQVTAMVNLLYDFNAFGNFVPYIGAGAGVGFVDSDLNLGSTTFAFQGILGVGYNWSPNLRFNLEGRYIGDDQSVGRRHAVEQQRHRPARQHPAEVRLGAAAAAAAAAGRDAAVVHGVLRLGPLEPVAAGPDDDPAGRQRLQDEG